MEIEPSTDNKNAFSEEQWTNLNAFVARLTALSSSIPAFDFSLYAIWTMRTAFEGDEIPESHVEAAKVWFLYAEETMERLSREEKTFDGKVAVGGDRFKDKEWRGFSAERLEVWRA
jgi:hypothetical protein